MPLPTFTAGQILTAAQLNAAFAGLFPGSGVDAWTPFTPSLTQGTSPTKTSECGYFKIGRAVLANYKLTLTGTGLAANEVRLGLPVTAAAAALVIGPGMLFDTSPLAIWKGVCYLESTSVFSMLPTSGAGTTGRLGVEGFTTALASGDQVWASIQYQSAS